MILKPKTTSFDLFSYNSTLGHFSLLHDNIQFHHESKRPRDVKFSFSYLRKNSKELFIILVSEEFNDQNMTYKRVLNEYLIHVFLDRSPEIIHFTPIRVSPIPTVYQLAKISNTLELIGAFITHNSIGVLFFRIDSTIQYCTVDEVNTYLILILIDFNIILCILVFECKVHSSD